MRYTPGMRKALLSLLFLVGCSVSEAPSNLGEESDAGVSSGSSGSSSGTSSGATSGSGSSGSTGAPSSSSGGGGGAPLQPGDRTITLSVGGESRTVVLHVPVSASPLPLILALHGNGDQASNFIRTSLLSARKDAIVAAPQGIQRSINVGGSTAPNVAWDAYNKGAAANSDVALLDALRAELGASSSVDLARIFVFGYSQGGYMAYRYAMEASDALSCAAVIAAANPGGTPTVFARKLPFMLQIGSNDYAIQNARQSKEALTSAGHEVQYNEVAGAGHTPFPGSKETPIAFCLGKTKT
jgi:predicted esterase